MMVFRQCVGRLIESQKSLLILVHLNTWGESGWGLIRRHMEILEEFDENSTNDIQTIAKRFKEIK